MYDDFDIPDMYDFLEVPKGKKPKVKKLNKPKIEYDADGNPMIVDEVEDYLDDDDF